MTMEEQPANSASKAPAATGRDPSVPAPAGEAVPAVRPAAAPETLGRGAVERVLRRAVELQSASMAGLDGLDENQMSEIAREMGIELPHLRRALAEERAGIAEPASLGVADRWLGPRRIATARPVRGNPSELVTAGTAWLERQEGLRLRRRLRDGVSAERDTGAIARIRTGLGLGRGTGHLRQADEVTLRVQPLDSDDSLVTMEADVGSMRRDSALLAASGLVAAGVAGFVGADLFGAGGWALALPALVGWGAAATASVRARLARIRSGMERTLDALALEDRPPPSLDERVAGAIEGARRFKTRIKLLSDSFRDQRDK